ncbi:alpha-L-fucosidase [Mangrovibacterium sp.]|uniref:alpha-L-fucosidase n=1 Tax=Mangrovibacterium sp. TaxID=1961364 RepID=UPI003562BDFC
MKLKPNQLKPNALKLNKFVFIAFFVTALLCLNACNSKQNTLVVQGDKHWVVLEAKDAKHTNGKFEWKFQLEHSGEYIIQLITTGDNQGSTPSAQVQIDDWQTDEELKSTFTIKSESSFQTVSQFTKDIIFSEEGKHAISITTSTPFVSIRIIPHFSNGIGSGKYYDQWLQMHNSVEKTTAMTWFKEAKFGMFIHWGLYSQAGGIWKGTRIDDSPYPGPKVAEWLMSTFQIPRIEYEELAKTFNPDKSFAENIARLAKDAGMKYVVITSKHHDGFALFDSKCSDYDMVDRTPYKADAVKELYDACLKEGLDFGIYYSHGNDWYDGGDGNYANVKMHNDSIGIYTHPQGKNLWDPSPDTHAEYLEAKAYPQIEELVRMLPKLRLIWFDGEGLITEEQAFSFYKLVYDINPNVIVNRRVGYDFGDYLDAGDNKIPSSSENIEKYWETCGTTNNSWGFKPYDQDWKSSRELLYYLIDIASKGGNYLLNIGPDGNGHVPEFSAKGLREMGKWMETNGESIYGTSRWKIVHEGHGETLLEGTGERKKKGFARKFSSEDFWFTSKENKVYAISLVESVGKAVIKSMSVNVAGKIKSVKMLGYHSELEWNQSIDQLEVKLPEQMPNPNGYALEISF